MSTRCRICIADVAEAFRRLGGAEVDIIHGRDEDAKSRVKDALMTFGSMVGYGGLSKETETSINKRLSEVLKELPRYKTPRVLEFLNVLRDIQFVVARDAAEYCQSVSKEQACSSSSEPKPASPETEAELEKRKRKLLEELEELKQKIAELRRRRRVD